MIRATTIVTCDVEGCGYSAQFEDLGGVGALLVALQDRGWSIATSDQTTAADGDISEPRLTCPLHKKAIRGEA